MYRVLFLHAILNKSPHIKVQLDIFLVFDWEDTWNSFIWKSVSLNISLKLVYPSLLPILVNNSIIIHPKLMPAAWKSFLMLPVFYSLCSISHLVPVNLTSNHQTCLLPSTSALASSVQVLIFVIFSRNLIVKALLTTSYIRQSRHPWWQRCNLTQFCLKLLQGTPLSTKWSQDRVAMVLPDLILPPSLIYFPPHNLHILCSDYTKFLIVSQKNSSKTSYLCTYNHLYFATQSMDHGPAASTSPKSLLLNQNPCFNKISRWFYSH